MPEWRYTINIKMYLNKESSSGDDSYRESQPAIVALLKESREYGSDETLQLITEELSDADDLEWFNSVLSELYDWADAHRVWMGL